MKNKPNLPRVIHVSFSGTYVGSKNKEHQIPYVKYKELIRASEHKHKLSCALNEAVFLARELGFKDLADKWKSECCFINDEQRASMKLSIKNAIAERKVNESES